MPNGFSKSRGLAQSILKAGVREGVSGSSILDTLRGSGLGYRRQDFYSDYRNYSRISTQRDTMKFVGYDRRLSAGNYIELPRFQKSNFAYVVDVEVRNPATGDTFSMKTTVASQHQLTRRQANETGLRAVLPSIDASKFDVLSYDWENAYHLRGTSWT